MKSETGFLHGQITGVIGSHTVKQFQLEAPEAIELPSTVERKGRCLLRWSWGWERGLERIGEGCTHSVETSHIPPTRQPMGVT